MTADHEAIVGEPLERIANNIVDGTALKDSRRAVHAAVDEVGGVRVAVVDRDRLVRAGQVGEDVGETE